MFKMYFLNLVKINSEITLSYLIQGKNQFPRLNKGSVILYHQLFGIPKKGGV